jgi:hypothetical protein
MFSFIENPPLPEDLMAGGDHGRKTDGLRCLRWRTILIRHNVLHSFPLILYLDIRTCGSRKSKRAKWGYKTKSEIAFMAHVSGDAKKLCSSPPLERLDVGAGRAEAESQSVSDDPYTEEPRYWQVLAIRLSSMLVLASIPFAVLLFTSENNIHHYASPDVLAVLGAGWAIFAIWLILDKGMDGILTKDPSEIAWSLIGVGNLVGVLVFFFTFLRQSG